MNERMETELESLRGSLRELEHRVVALERLAVSGPGSEAAVVPDDAAAVAEPDSGVQVPAIAGFIGRTLLVLAGGFLLRAVTDAGVLARAPGSAVGLAYALAWILLADRAAARGGRTSAVFHILSGSLIAFPLLAEATYKYRLLTPPAAAIGVAAVTAIFLAAAWRRSLLGGAWIVTGAAVVTSFGVAVLCKGWIPMGYTLLAVSVFTLSLLYSRKWVLLAWGAGLALNLMVALELLLALVPRTLETAELDPGGLAVFLRFVVLVYVAVFGLRTLVGGQNVRAFEIVQSAGVILMGILGAVLVAAAAGRSRTPAAVLSLALAAGAYGVAFAFVDRRADRRTNFLYYTTLALPLTLIALAALFPRPAFVFTCSGLAVASAWLGGHFSRVTLNVHGAVYAVAAALASGLVAASARSFLETPDLERWSRPALMVALAAVASCAWISAAGQGRRWGRFSRAPKLVLLATFVACVSGLVVAWAASVLPWTRGPEVDAGALATLRTGILAGAALALGWAARVERLFEARWLVYPVLVAGAVKLVADDFSHGRPTTLFLSLAFLGTALIVAPRLTRRAAQLPG